MRTMTKLTEDLRDLDQVSGTVMLREAADMIEALAAALLRKFQEDNACWYRSSYRKRLQDTDAPPCGHSKWNSEKCGCAIEARAFFEAMLTD